MDVEDPLSWSEQCSQVRIRLNIAERTFAHRTSDDVYCCLAAGMALLGSSERLGVLLGDKPDGDLVSDHSRGLALAMIGLWIMNLFTNVMQGPCRALINDIVDKDYLQAGNAIASAIMGSFLENVSLTKTNSTTHGFLSFVFSCCCRYW